MPTSINWIEFAAAVLLIELTPGPNMAWLAALGLAEGRRAGLVATAGVGLGLALNAMLAALGLVGLLDGRNMATSLALLPFAPIGVWVGVRIAHRINPVLFYRLVYTGMFLTGCKRLWDAWR